MYFRNNARKIYGNGRNVAIAPSERWGELIFEKGNYLLVWKTFEFKTKLFNFRFDDKVIHAKIYIC